MDPKLLTRDQFREAVFARDGYRCVFCRKTAEQTPTGKLDAHHIVERRLWSDGGYYLDNGATVCEDHHLDCEMTFYSVEQVREAAGITKVLVPDQFYPEQRIDKWGNYILDDGVHRTRGELFFDESVQKVLALGGYLKVFKSYVKYGRTFHIPWSPGAHDDDKTLSNTDHFHGRRIIASKKMDGENTSGYWDGHVHARSIDSKGGEDRAWVKSFLVNNVCFNLPEGWRVCGENLWAEHSIHYNDLPSYFLGFSIWNEQNVCLSWDETVDWFAMLDITPVPVLYDGLFEDCDFKALEKSLNLEKDEGYVVRVADAFTYGQFKTSVAKFVRAGHVATTVHWRRGQHFKPNGLLRDEGSLKG